MFARAGSIACVFFYLCFGSAGWLQAGEEVLDWYGTKIRTYVVKPDRVELYWSRPDGTLFRQLSVLQGHLESQGRRVRMLMNAGLFEDNGVPCGLLITDGKERHPLNLKEGVGNFYLKPNGVFYIDERGARVVSTEEYLRSSLHPRLAVQSGPLLLREGRIHPAFQPNSKNLLHRNGVGMLPSGEVIFAITEFSQPQRINLYQFAAFFRSRGCRDALFLDGDLSQMEVDPKGLLTPSNYLGALFGVSEWR